MNQGCHRVVFNRLRGQWLAVAEAARSHSRAPGTGRICRRARLSVLLPTAAASLVLASPEVDAQIVAYRPAPGNQRPTVLEAGNGVPLVNIQTPSAAGVSRNTYSQFDVGQSGAILNNSRKGAPTALAGQVAGNPWLARGTAKVILNEVVAGNPSQLRGVIEVAGDRAEVVIANPAGIDVDGAGFINASRATLTTGTATVANGSLQGYEVRQGTITVQGGGLDASQTDYAAVLARAVRINGAVHAKELKVIAGANRISADHQQVTPIAGTGAAPAFAVDVSALGGMYAGKITLIGTEAGVGVRNAGTIAASAGEVVITADGRLENSGQILSHADAAVDAAGGVGNSGTLYARGSIRVVTRRGIDNSGLIGAQANTTLEAPGEMGEIVGRPGSILVAGLMPDGSFAPGGDLTLGAGRHIRVAGTNRAGNRIDAESPSISLGGSQTTGRFIHLEAIPNSRRPRSRRDPLTGRLADGAAGGAIDLSGATLVAEEDLSVLGGSVLRTDGARIVSAHLDLGAHSLSNRGGSLHQTGGAPLELDFPGGMDNSQGSLSANSSLTLRTGSLSNDGGSIQSSGALTVSSTGHLDNGTGLLAGGGGTAVQACSLSNRGLIAGIVGSQGALDNAGQITGSASAGGILSNRGAIGGDAAGTEISNQGSIGGNATAAAHLDNTGLVAGRAAAGTLANGGVILGTASAITDLDNSGFVGGQVLAGRDLQNTGLIAGPASAQRHVHNSGQVAADVLAAGQLHNSGEIGGLALAGTDLHNAGTIHGDALAQQHLSNGGRIAGAALAGQRLTNGGDIGLAAVAASDLDNTGAIGGNASAGGSLGNRGTIAGSASAGRHLGNSGTISGSAEAGGNLDNAGNIGGSAQAAGSLGNSGGIGGNAWSGMHLNNGGSIAGAATAAGHLNNSGSIGSSASAGSHLDNSGHIGGAALAGDRIGNTGQIAGSAQAGNAIDNAGSIGSGGGAVSVSARQVSNSGSIGLGGAQVTVSAGRFDNDGGQVSGWQVGIQAGQLSNVQGRVQAGDRLLVASQGTLDNTGGVLAAGGNSIIADSGDPAHRTLNIVNTGGSLTAGRSLAIAGSSLSFDGLVASRGDFSAALAGDYTYTPGQDFFQASGAVSLSFTGTVTNHDRWHVDGGLRVSGGQVLNTGEISSNGLTLVQAAGGTLANQGLIQGDRVVVGGHDLANQGGRILGNTLVAEFSGNADNTGGRIDIAGAAQIQVGGSLDNTAGRIDTGSLQLRVGGDLINQTVLAATSQQRLHGWSGAGLTQGTASEENAGPRAGITARNGDLDLFVGGNLQVTGADLTAAGHLDGLVLGDIQMGGLNLASQGRSITTTGFGDFGDGGGSGLSTSTSRVERTDRLLAATLTTGGDLSLIAGGNAGYRGLDISAVGDLTLGAVTGDLTLAAAVDGHEIHELTSASDGRLTTRDEVTTTATGGQLGAGGAIRLLAGHDLQLVGISATAGGGTLTVAAGHDIDAASLATGTAALRVEQTPLPADEFSMPASQSRIEGDLSVEHHGGRFAAQGDIVFDAGHGNPFGTGFVTGIRQARLGAGLDADAVAPAVGGDATLGNLRLSGVDLISGSPGQARDITLAAAGHVLVTGTRDSVATRRTPEANPYAGWIAPADAAEPVITLTPGTDHGQFQGRTVRIRTDQGDIQLTGLRLAAGTDILAHSGGDTVIDSSQLTAGRDLSIHALGELRIDGLVANPEVAPPMADTLNGHAIPTSAQATLTAGRDMSLTGVEGVTARGFALQGRDIAVSTLGDLDLAGGHLRESWSGRNDQHERDTAVAGRIQGRSLTLQALGEDSNIHLAHLDVTTSGATRLRATGDITIDPGADYAYDHWTESHSSGFIVEKTTTTDHVRESLTIRPTTFQVGGFDLQAGGDLTLTATVIDSQGTPSLQAGGDIQYRAAHHTRYSQDESHTSRGILGLTFQRRMDRHTEASSTAAVTSIQGQGDVLSYADGNTTLEGTRITSATGRVTVVAGKDLDILPAVNSSFVEDVHQSSSAISFNGGIGFNRKVKDATQTTDITLTGSHIEGDSVLLQAGGDAHLVAASVSGTHGAWLAVGGDALVESGLNTNVQVHDHQESAFGVSFTSGSGRLPGMGGLDRIHQTHFHNAVPVASQFASSQGTVSISAGGSLGLLGIRVSAQQDIGLAAGGKLLVAGSQAVTQTKVFDEASGSWLNTSDGYEDLYQQTTIAHSELTAGGRVAFRAGEGVTLGAVHVRSGNQTIIESPQVDFVGEVGGSYTSHRDWDTDFLYAINAGRGQVDETISLAHIDAGGGIVLPTGTRVSVQLDAGAQSLTANELQALARQTGELPGMAWLKDLAERPDVDWQAIQTAHRHWDYRAQGLTEGGAIVITVIVSMLTYGYGAEWLNAMGTTTTTTTAGAAAGTTATTTAGLGTVSTATTTLATGATTTTTTTTLIGHMANAGVSSLFSQAAVSFVNNGGNLSATLHDLGSSGSMRGLLGAMLSGGVAGSFGNSWSLERLAAQTVTGCATAEIAGGDCASGAGWALGTGAMSWTGHYLRQQMINDSMRFPGIVGTSDRYELSNQSGQSVGVDGDGFKLAGGRVDVGRICGEGRCLMDGDNNYVLDGQGRIQFIGNSGNLEAYLDANPEWRSPMGGWQGGVGKFAFFNYRPGSFWDKLAEAYAGPHDWFNKFIWYDAQGSIRPGVNGSWLGVVGNLTNYTNVLLATPFALSTLLPPGIWEGVSNINDRDENNEHP
jgi:filamentous hemagglutinin